eukprot:scaffold16256_cov75-Phaeocystis_antarctica.AAC.2
MQRHAQHVGHPESNGRFVERVHVGHLDLERQHDHRLVDRLLHHIGHRCGLLPFWYDDRDASRHNIHLVGSAAWAEAPGRASRGRDASCLGIEAWWGILAVVEATQSTVAPERASRAWDCGRCLSGAHGACGALETHGLPAHAHEAAGRARHTRAQPLRARNSAWAARRLLRAARRRKVARVGLRALTSAGEAGGAGVGALPARQRRAGTLGAVRALLARLARRLLLLVLERAFSARRAETHTRLSCDRAGSAGPRRGATRGRIEARLGRVALRCAAQVGTIRVRALLARQRSACAKRAEVAWLAGGTRLLALVGLVRAGCALVARTHADVWGHRAGAAPGLLGAARRCKVAWVNRRALPGTTQVSGDRVRALAARQRCRRALRAVRARRAHVTLGPAGFVHELSRAALDARRLLVQWLHGPRAAGRRLGAACGCVKAWYSWRAIASGAEVRRVGVRARRARQRRAGTRGAVRARIAGNARLLALVGLVLAGRAFVAPTLSGDWLDGAGAAWRLLRAARRREVARVGLRALASAGEASGAGVGALPARQRRAGTLGAVRALLARLARRLLRLVLERAFSARRAETHARLSCDRAGPAGSWRGATRGRVEARLGRVALRCAAKVGSIRVRALLARQRSACAKRAEVAWLAGDARLLALSGLVRACLALAAPRLTGRVRKVARRAVNAISSGSATSHWVGGARRAREACGAVLRTLIRVVCACTAALKRQKRTGRAGCFAKASRRALVA